MDVFSSSSPEQHSPPLHRLPLDLIPATLNPVCVFISHPSTSRQPSLSFRSLSPSLTRPLSLPLSRSLARRGCSRFHSCMSEQQTARQQQSAGAALCASPSNPADKARARSAEPPLLPLSPSSSLSPLRTVSAPFLFSYFLAASFPPLFSP